QGEQQAQKALDKVTNGPAPTPADPATKKADNAAVVSAKQQADQVVSSTSGTGSIAAPTPSAVAPPLPPQVAAVVKTVPPKNLLKAARTKSPRKLNTSASQL